MKNIHLKKLLLRPGWFTRAILCFGFEMSEFRQYRLASQLFDRYNCLRDPNSYTPHLFEQKYKNNISRV